jgi:hypothetical protein
LAYGWDPNSTSSCVVHAAAEEMTMARVSAKNRARIQELKARVRQGRMLQAKRGKPPDIPTEVLQKLASLRLPNNPWVYQVCLDALMRGM